MKIVINRCFGGFGLSWAAVCALRDLGHAAALEASDRGKMWSSYLYEIKRDDPLLVQVVEKLGQAASGEFAELAIIEIPDGVKWRIEEYDGNEHIAEDHQTWC